MSIAVAIAGCPNSGKTTLFNRLAGARETVGNWPGQTVDRHEGRFSAGGIECDVTDLPGTYGLVAVSAEETITARYLIEHRPDVVITVVDATNPGPGLHLLAQIAEMGLRQVIALNMWDAARRKNIVIDVDRLARLVGSPVVPTVARQGEGIDALGTAVAEVATTPAPSARMIDYGPPVELVLCTLATAIDGAAALRRAGPARWVALQLLAGDEHIGAMLDDGNTAIDVRDIAITAAPSIAGEAGFGPAVVIAEKRFRWVTGVIEQTVGSEGSRLTTAERIDRILTHRWLGLPVFLVIMWVVMRFTADVTAPYLDWIDVTISGPVSRWTVAGLAAVSLGGGWVESLIVDGVLAGVGGVLVFVPVLLGLYLVLAVLEDSGYMARAAAVMERTMRAVGIPGKAFLPMMVGFGCTVPAIYATRTLESRRDRLLTGMLTPFMSCGARLPVYVLLAGVFFAGNRSTIVFAMYLLGVLVAVLIGGVLSRTLLKEDEPGSFVIVMPDFRRPNARTVWALVKDRTWDFVKGAGTVILIASMAVWLLLAIPLSSEGSFADVDAEGSVFGGVSKAIAPVYAPAGFDDWEQSGSLITGFVAKEVVVGTMAQLYLAEEADTEESRPRLGEDLLSVGSGFIAAAGETIRALPGVVGLDFIDISDDSSSDLHSAIFTSFERSSGGHARAAGLAFMVFVLLYTPCMAAVAAFRQEFGVRWMWVSVVGQFAIAWLGAVAVFQVGTWVGL